jgi:hypothetical protein
VHNSYYRPSSDWLTIYIHIEDGKRIQEAFEDKSPGGLKVLLSSPRWERRLLRFLDLSGVSKIVENGVDEEERSGNVGGVRYDNAFGTRVSRQ